MAYTWKPNLSPFSINEFSHQISDHVSNPNFRLFGLTFEPPLYVSAFLKESYFYALKSPWKCTDSRLPQMFISITDFQKDADNFSHILITVIDAMGQPEQTKRFDKNTNFHFGEWIQDGCLKI